MTCTCHTSKHARSLWALFATVVLILAAIGGCSQSAHAAPLYVIQSETGQHVNPVNTRLPDAPAGQEYVQTCRTSQGVEKDPNYQSKPVANLFKQLGNSLAPHAPEPAQLDDRSASTDWVRDSDNRAHRIVAVRPDGFMDVEYVNCSYLTRAIPPPDEHEQARRYAAAHPREGARPMTPLEVAQFVNAHPTVPHPIGGGLWAVRIGNRDFTGTEWQISELESAHGDYCMSLYGNAAAEKANACYE